MVATRFSESSANIYQTTRYRISQESNVCRQNRENFKYVMYNVSRGTKIWDSIQRYYEAALKRKIYTPRTFLFIFMSCRTHFSVFPCFILVSLPLFIWTLFCLGFRVFCSLTVYIFILVSDLLAYFLLSTFYLFISSYFPLNSNP
jgi:hypothetical protein